MKRYVLAVAFASLASLAWAQDKAKAPAAPEKAKAPAGHMMYSAKKLDWKDLPSIPGAKIALLEGPMSEAVPFTARLKIPGGAKIMPHTHPGIEHVTVISGEFSMGHGEKWDDKGMHALQAGDVMIIQPNNPHYAKTKGETIVQIHGMGPWKVVYVNPDDDPAKKAAAAPKTDEKKK
jgi:quercetin dioxygenase-like cupin family protein